MDNHNYQLFDRMLEGVQIINDDWEYVYVNEAVAEQGKSTVKDLIGQSMLKMYPGIENTEMFQSLKLCMLEREHSTMSNTFNFPDGSIGYFELKMYPIEEGVLIFSFDVTKQKLAEQLLKEKNENLRDEVSSKESEIDLRTTELSQFTYLLSHDLKEPLRTISNFSEILLKSNYERVDDVGKSSIKFIQNSAIRMSGLFTALFDYLDIGSGDLISKNTECKAFVKEIFQYYMSAEGSESFEYEIGELPTIKVFPLEFRLLLNHLIGNAIKFKSNRRRLKIRFSALKRNNYWEFKMEDNGDGIPSNYIGKIFEPFNKYHKSNDTLGAGIGLAICKKIILLHRGEIWIESETDKGTDVYFTIPD